jgi:transglutaminase-like putative cysteine protease
MRYSVRHRSTLSYAQPVARAQFNLRLVPRPWPHQALVEQSLDLSPAPTSRRELAGPYWGNTTQLAFEERLETFDIESAFAIDVAVTPPPASGSSIADIRTEALAERDLSELAPAPFLFGSRIAAPSAVIAAWGAPHLDAGEPILAAAQSIMHQLHREFSYDTKATTSRTPPEDAFAKRAGVCQDFAHVMIIALRAAGIPAAYVSGYLLTLPPPGKQKLVGADAMHAWVDVWCGSELGWVGFDPTNNRMVGEDHIAIGMGRDYADVAPINGTFIGSAPQSLKTGVDVSVIDVV